MNSSFWVVMVLVNDCFFSEPTLLKKRDIHMVLLQTSLNYWFHTWHGQVDGFQEWWMKYQDQQQTTARNIHQDSHGRSKDIKQDRSWRGHVILKQSSHQAVSYPRIDSWVKAPAPQTKSHIQHEWNATADIENFEFGNKSSKFHPCIYLGFFLCSVSMRG